jgi:TolB-like protein/DNA-binding winged helix-turn-helix (wHTH) protein/tetratricopeptide (TPR) repeat protein
VFELDLRSGELRKGPTRLKVPDQSIEILRALLEQPGELVTREQLRDRLWPADTFVDFEHGLNAAVRRLREALGDSADTPRFIETLPRRGYRFVGAIELAPGAGTSPASSDKTPPPPPAQSAFPTRLRTAGRRLAIGAGITGVVAAALAMGLPTTVSRLRQYLPLTRVPPQIESVAVLPLANLSGNSDVEWFTDGMTDALIGELSRIGRLKVISRTSTMRYRGTQQTLPEIARELKVDGIVTGTVLREGGQVRISVHLYHGPTEDHLWGHTFKRELRSILALHSEVALTVARQLKVRLTPSEQASFSRARPIDPETYEAFLKGRFHGAKLTADGMSAAIDNYQRALSRSPDYAAAAADLALAYWIQGWYLEQLTSSDALLARRTTALALAERAVRLDDTSAQAHATLGWFRFWSLDWAAAERAFLKALDLDASNANARHGYAFYLTTMGRLEEAIVQMRQARELDPASPTIAAAAHWVFYCARRYEEAASELAEARTLQPQNSTVLTLLGNIRSLQGRHREALNYLQMAADLGVARSPRVLAILTGVHARAGQADEALKVLSEMTTRARRAYMSPMWLARAHAAAGRSDEALTWLERAYEGSPLSDELTTIGDPVWDSLRDRPRFQVVLRKMGIQQ